MSSIKNEVSLDQYMAEIAGHPVLSREEEVLLARRYRDNDCQASAQRLVTSNLRFVVKMAHKFRGYRMNILDLVQEGNLGLTLAVKKFDPDRGYRLISYAEWWIRAYMQSYILRSWSLVKLGTTQAQRKLLFRMRSERASAERNSADDTKACLAEVARRLDVAEKEVLNMDVRLAERDFSLDSSVIEGSRTQFADLVECPRADPEEVLGKCQMHTVLSETISALYPSLNTKEQHILEHRILGDDRPTLQQVGDRLNVSRERVRQIEKEVIKKLRSLVFHATLKGAA